MAVPLIVAKLLEAGLGILGGAILSKGKEVVEDKLGVNIEEMLQTDEGKLKLLEAQNSHKEFLLQNVLEHRSLDLKEAQIDTDNTASARAMQVAALQQEDIFSKRYLYFFSSFWSVFSVIYLLLITFAQIPEANIRFADTIVGFLLGTIISAIVNFFLGSSRQSKTKDDTLASIAKSLSEK